MAAVKRTAALTVLVAVFVVGLHVLAAALEAVLT